MSLDALTVSTVGSQDPPEGTKRVREGSESREGERPKKRRRLDPRSRNWFFTWNNYPDDWKDRLLAIGGLKKYCCQPEVAASGTRHIQGVLVFSDAKKQSTLENAVDNLVHWEVARNIAACKNYCSKMESKDGDVWVKGFRVKKRKVVDPLAGKELFAYQQEIVDMVDEEPDDRKVYWYWSDKGGIGKSALCKHLVMKHDALVVGGKFRDAYYAVATLLKKGEEPYIIIFDIPRAQGDKMSYTAIEGIKNGCFFSSKYESGMCVFNVPHIICFANCAPNMGGLSSDRWVVKCLDSEADLQSVGTMQLSFGLFNNRELHERRSLYGFGRNDELRPFTGQDIPGSVDSVDDNE